MRRIINKTRTRAMTVLWLMADDPLFRAYAVKNLSPNAKNRKLLELAIQDECTVVRREAAAVLRQLAA